MEYLIISVSHLKLKLKTKFSNNKINLLTTKKTLKNFKYLIK